VAARSIQEPPAPIISLVGDLDVASAEEVDVALESAIAATDPVVLDLRATTSADSSILATILKAYTRAGRRGFAVVLASRGPVARLFTLLDAYSVVPVFASPVRAAEWCYRGSLQRSR
jgi:anti-anti-sigma factor